MDKYESGKACRNEKKIFDREVRECWLTAKCHRLFKKWIKLVSLSKFKIPEMRIQSYQESRHRNNVKVCYCIGTLNNNIIHIY